MMEMFISSKDPRYTKEWCAAVPEFFDNVPVQDFNFKECNFRIDDTVYTELSDEFIKVIEQYKMLELLKK